MIEWFIIAFLWYYVGLVAVWLVNTDVTLAREWEELPRWKRLWYISVMPLGFLMIASIKAFKK